MEDFEYSPGSRAKNGSLEDLSNRPTRIPTCVYYTGLDRERGMKRGRREISYIQSAGHRTPPVKIMQQLHHGGVQDRSDYSSLDYAVIPLKPLINNYGASVCGSGGRTSHLQPVRVCRSAGKALVVKRHALSSRRGVCHYCYLS